MSEAVEYRDIPGFPGYRVGNDGSVWSCWHRKGLGPGRGSRFVLGEAWSRLSPSVGDKRSPYPRVTVWQNKKRTTRTVHSLVMLAFVGPYPNEMEIAHENGIPQDCRLSNLSYKTRSENQHDRKRHGTDDCGEKNTQTKLTKDKVLSMRAERAAVGTSYERLGRKHGVSKKAAMWAVKGLRWGHVNG